MGHVNILRRKVMMGLAATSLAPVLISSDPVVASTEPENSGQIMPPDGAVFDHAWLVAEAKRLAALSYVTPPSELPNGFDSLTYDQYRDIRFKETKRIWRDEKLQFQLDVLPGGFFFTKPIHVGIVENGAVTPLISTPDMFDFGPAVPPLPAGTALPFSGFRVRNQVNNAGVWDEFLVFQGASYFRAVAKSQLYGLSTRGLSVNTATAEGEEFPDFTAFWIEKPDPASNFIVIHALLDGPSATGAYRFTARPGVETVVDVEATIFARADLTNFGLGPLTTMFLFDSTNRHRFDDFRPAVHDSNGLQMMSGAGEWIWRPLANPAELQVSAFVDNGIRGFGLVQRSLKFSDFEDLEALYERRPSLWVEPVGDWGKGQVELVEIPTTLETNDNIVAFWKPDEHLAAGNSLAFSYRLHWGTGPGKEEELARVAYSRIGQSFDKKRVLFVVEYDTPFDPNNFPMPLVETSSGKISNVVIQANPNSGGSRVSFELDPEDAKLAELRLQLKAGDKPVSETWLYRWIVS
jgi:glucans biosynthesis protein